MRSPSKLIVGLLAMLAAAGFWVAATTPAGAQPAPAALGTVVVVHGLVDFPADVYLDGASTPALSGFEFRRVTDALALPAGMHRADLRRAGQPVTATPTLSGSFTVVAGQRVTVAALLDPEGKPSWIAFANDALPIDAARGELRFRHFAAAAPVRVTVDGQPALDQVTNLARSGQAAPISLAPGLHRIGVLDGATGAVLVADRELDIGAGLPVNLYLTGRAPTGGAAATAGSVLTLLQEVPAAPELKAVQVLPAVVPSGDSGLAAPSEAHRGPWSSFTEAMTLGEVAVGLASTRLVMGLGLGLVLVTLLTLAAVIPRRATVPAAGMRPRSGLRAPRRRPE